MSARYTKLILIVFLLLGVLSFILGCVSAMPLVKKEPSPNPNNMPVRDLIITMDVNRREEFFAQLRKFADKHSLEFTLSLYGSDNTIFLIAIYGDGFHITSAGHTISPREIDVTFINETSTPTPQKVVDELFDDLKSFINEIPNVTIKEKLKSLKMKIDENQREELFNELFTQLQEFANQHSLEFTVSSYDADLRTFLVEMHGDGFQITSEAVRNPPREINVDFYIHYDDNGTPTSTSQETVNELFDDLKSSLGKFPNVTIVDDP